METNKVLIYNSRRANPTTVWILFVFLGWSYGSLGQIGKQMLFYLTLGGLGVWTIIRLFTLNKSIKEYNKKISLEIGLTEEEIKVLGV